MLKIEKIRLFYLDEFLKEITGLNTELLLSIRDGQITCDLTKLLFTIQVSLKKGVIAGTTENLLLKPAYFA